jgi:hypothetical protein
MILGKNKLSPKMQLGLLEGVYGLQDLILVAFVEENLGLLKL